MPVFYYDQKIVNPTAFPYGSGLKGLLDLNLVLENDQVSGGKWVYVDNSFNPIATPSPEFFNEAPVYSKIQTEIIDGQYMVKVPKFYCTVETVPFGPYAGKKVWRLANTPKIGYSLHSGFYWGGLELNQFWFGSYAGSLSGGKLCSVPGVMPAVNRTIVQFSADAAARNTGGVTGFMQQNYHQISARNWLYLLEHATMDSKLKLGRGRLDVSSAAFVDAPDVAQATYRGMVGIWGNVEQWVVGMTVNSGLVYVWNNNQQLINTGLYLPNLTRQWKYSTAFASVSGSGFDLSHGFIGSKHQDSDFMALCPEGHYVSTYQDRVLLSGGLWSSNNAAGIFCLSNALANNDAFSHIGARLTKV